MRQRRILSDACGERAPRISKIIYPNAEAAELSGIGSALDMGATGKWIGGLMDWWIGTQRPHRKRDRTRTLDLGFLSDVGTSLRLRKIAAILAAILGRRGEGTKGKA
jgi:hypothetical protein